MPLAAEGAPLLHVALIMDGNGRWARRRGLPRTAGHRRGADAVRRVVEAAPGLGIGTLTLYAFSSDNWKRPRDEVRSLMRLFDRFLTTETARCEREGVRLSVIGRRDRLRPSLVGKIADSEGRTRAGRRLHLRLAVDYSSRDAIVAAAGRLDGRLDRRGFGRCLGDVIHSPGVPDVDLLIRTGGERRLSDFLLWESAYAELVFTDTPWPDFDAEELRAAIDDFAARERRFGALPSPSEDLAGFADAS